jgi:hypothetical protein
MMRAACFALLAGAVLALNGGAAEQKGTVVDLDGIKATAPASWKTEEPSNKMRFAQFRLKGKGEGQDAELVIFKGLGGGAKQNVERWKGQFLPPEGKTIDDVSKVSDIKFKAVRWYAPDKMATRLEVSGTYKFKFPPFDPNAKEEKKANYKMVAIYFEGPEDIYQIKLTGPAKTVDEHLKEFDDWVKAFK